MKPEDQRLTLIGHEILNATLIFREEVDGIVWNYLASAGYASGEFVLVGRNDELDIQLSILGYALRRIYE